MCLTPVTVLWNRSLIIFVVEVFVEQYGSIDSICELYCLGNYYGTSQKAVLDVLQQGKLCLLDIDSQGVKSVKGTDLNPVLVFIKPPSLEVLEHRLRSRGTETEEAIQKRLAAAGTEISFGSTPGIYDHTIINDDLDVAYTQLKSIIDQVMRDNSASIAHKQASS